MKPIKQYLLSGNDLALKLGRHAVASGKVGAVILAGGQGTRLGIKGPKGTYPISPIKKKSLFQIFCEKTTACEKCVKQPLYLAFMTSPENHEDTYYFFKKYNFFDRKPSSLDFFIQSTLPLEDTQGNYLRDSHQRPICAADGNGSFFWTFMQSGLYDKWKKEGIEYVTVMVIDNPLGDPFDFELIGTHISEQADACIKAIEKKEAHEKVGCIAEKKNKLTVVEYSEMSEEDKQAKDKSGRLRYCLANISNFCFSMSFIKHVASYDIHDLPLHKAQKKPAGFSNYVTKSEYFIFDALTWAEKISVLLYPREEVFAPLKNSQGEDSPETVQRALIAKDKKIFEAITSTVITDTYPLELSFDFHYPTKDLLEKWAGRTPPRQTYIES